MSTCISKYNFQLPRVQSASEERIWLWRVLQSIGWDDDVIKKSKTEWNSSKTNTSESLICKIIREVFDVQWSNFQHVLNFLPFCIALSTARVKILNMKPWCMDIWIWLSVSGKLSPCRISRIRWIFRFNGWIWPNYQFSRFYAIKIIEMSWSSITGNLH